MSIALDFCCQVLLFTNPSLVALSVTTGVSGCWWPIYYGAVLMAAPHQKLINNSPNYASIALARKFFIVLHSTWMGLLSGWGLWGGFSGFVYGSLN